MSELLSSRVLLAIQTASFIACHGQHGAPVKSSRIIERYNLNKRSLEPILQTLSRAGIVESKQGASGGYLIADPGHTTLGEVAALFIAAPNQQSLCFSDWRSLLLPSLEKAHRAALASLNAITLKEIAERAAEEGLNKDAGAPLDFII